MKFKKTLIPMNVAKIPPRAGRCIEISRCGVLGERIPFLPVRGGVLKSLVVQYNHNKTRFLPVRGGVLKLL